MQGFRRTFGSVIGNNSRDNSEDDRAPCCAVSRSGCGSNHAGDGTGAPTDHGPFPC